LDSLKTQLPGWQSMPYLPCYPRLRNFLPECPVVPVSPIFRVCPICPVCPVCPLCPDCPLYSILPCFPSLFSFPQFPVSLVFPQRPVLPSELSSHNLHNDIHIQRVANTDQSQMASYFLSKSNPLYLFEIITVNYVNTNQTA